MPRQMPRLLCLILLLLLASPIFAEPDPVLPAGCELSPGPAATLIVPYFEVDLEDPSGPTTFFSIANAGALPTLVNMVIWTDWGLPVLTLPLSLAGDGLQSFDLRRILAEGRLPPAPNAPGCLLRDDLRADELELLAVRLTGRPSPEDGLCWGSPRGETSVAKGYVTIDVVERCPAPGATTPGEPSGCFGATFSTSIRVATPPLPYARCRCRPGPRSFPTAIFRTAST